MQVMLSWMRFTLVLLFFSFSSFAEKVELIANINLTPVKTWAGKHLTSYQNKIYFAANDSVLGEELYSYDPQTRNTSLIMDINIGEGDSQISDLLVFQNKLHFFAFDGSKYGLYQYDELNQLRVLDKFTYLPSDLTVYKEELYFVMQHGFDKSLYKFDSAKGKAEFKFLSGSTLNNNSQLIVVEEKLYMILPWDYYGGIMVYDKSTDKTLYLNGVAQNSFDEIMGFQAFTSLFHHNDKLYVNYPSKGVALYDPQSNIITNVTPNLSDFNSVTLLTIHNNNLFLAIDTSKLGKELYRYDLVTNDYNLIGDIYIGKKGSSPKFIGMHDNRLLFSAESEVYGRELYTYDFENGEVNLAADIIQGSVSSDPNKVVALGTELFLAVNDDHQKPKIVNLSQDLSEYLVLENFSDTGTSSSKPSSFVEYQEQLYFSADGGDVNKNQLYRYAASEEVVKVSESDILGPAVEYQNKLYFANRSGRGLIAYSPDSKTTSVLSDYEQGWPFRAQSLTVANEKLYFTSSNQFYGVNENYLYEYDANTVKPLLSDDLIGEMSDLIDYQSNLYFYLVSHNSVTRQASVKLFEFKTTASELDYIFETSVSNVDDEFLVSKPNIFFIEQDKLYFTAPNENGEQQLFTYEGNTQQIVQLNNSPISSIVPTIYGGKWYLPTTTQNSPALKIFDTGTEQSTIIEINPYVKIGALPFDLTIYNNKLYFKVAQDGVVSLYVYDFDTQQISLTPDTVTDKPISYLNPSSKMKVHKNKLYFSGLLEGHGYELFSLHSNHLPVGSIDITGNAIENLTVSASSNFSDPDGEGKLSYQWYRGSTPIEGETSVQYVITPEDVGKSIMVVGSYYDGEGTYEQITSKPVTPSRKMIPKNENQDLNSGGSPYAVFLLLILVHIIRHLRVYKSQSNY